MKRKSPKNAKTNILDRRKQRGRLLSEESGMLKTVKEGQRVWNRQLVESWYGLHKTRDGKPDSGKLRKTTVRTSVFILS